MIRQISDLLFRVRHPYRDMVTIQRARSLLIISWASLITSLIVLPLMALGVIGLADQAFSAMPLAFIVIPALNVALIGLIQTGRLNSAVWIYVSIPLITVTVISVTSFGYYAPFALMISLIVAGLLLSQRQFLVAIVLVAAVMGLRLLNLLNFTQPITLIPPDTIATEFTVYLIIFGASALFLFVFAGGTDRITRATVRDVAKLNATSRLLTMLTRDLSDGDIAAAAARVLSESFEFESVDFFLSDGAGGVTRPLRGGARLSASDTRVIERTLNTRRPVFVNEGDADSNHLLPPARSSLTLPLFDGDNLLGALDVQIIASGGFSTNDISALQGVANMVARSLTANRFARDLTRTVREQEETIRRSLVQIAELRQRSQQISETSWGRYLQGRGEQSLGYDMSAAENGMLIPAADLPDEMRAAIIRGEIHIAAQGNTQVVNVPIRVRQQVLGALAFTLPAQRNVSERQLDLLRTVTDRLGVALENNRLFEQTQAQAQRERRASEISAMLLGATNVDAVLALAADSFNEALGAVRTRISVEPGALADEKAQTAPLRPLQGDGL